jgi:hypothetical protein
MLVSSSLTVLNVHARSSMPTPSVPEFIVKLVNNSYFVPPIYGTDPYTGQSVVTSAGHYVENESIEVIIQNQPFTPYWTIINSVNYTINLYFGVNSKGHFAQDWPNLNPQEYQAEDYASQYTDVLEYTNNIPSSGQIDFQVQAFIGYIYTNYTGPPSSYGYIGLERSFTKYLFNGTESGWSNTQTITIGASTPVATPTPPMSPSPVATALPKAADSVKNTTSTSPSQTQLLVIIIVLLAVIVGLIIAIIIMNRSQKRNRLRE